MKKMSYSFTILTIASAIGMMCVASCNNGNGKLSHDDSAKIAKTFVEAPTNNVKMAARGVADGEKISGTLIDSAQALEIIKTYQDENNAADDNCQIKTVDGKPLNGFYISRSVFDNLLKNEEVNGFRIYLSKFPGAEVKRYTITLVSTRKDPDGGNDIDFRANGMYENFSPCPDNCTK